MLHNNFKIILAESFRREEDNGPDGKQNILFTYLYTHVAHHMVNLYVLASLKMDRTCLFAFQAAGYINEIKHQRGKCTSETIDEGMQACVS
jgi:hypothetical protein